jgi:hypothetical protein
MTTSGSYDFNLDRDGIITEAYSLTGSVAIGETPTTAELTDGGKSLNIMLKGWQAKGYGLWLNQEITVFPGYAEKSVLLGPTGGHASATIVKTEVKVAGVATDLTIDVDSITGMTNGDYIGIELDSGALQWTTINGVPAGYTVTLAAALTGAAAIDNHVYTYTTKTQRPLSIIEARLITADEIEIPIEVIPRDTYMLLSNKDTTGLINQVYYDPQLTNGKLYVWPTSSDVQNRIEMTIKKPIMDFDASADDGEFPQEWFEAITTNLAVRIGIKNGVPLDPELKELAMTSLYDVRGFDQEQESMFFQPRLR